MAVLGTLALQCGHPDTGVGVGVHVCALVHPLARGRGGWFLAQGDTVALFCT